MIPHTLHHIWLGPNPMPAQFEEFRSTWNRLHPEWEHMLWTEENLPTGLRHPEIYDQARVPAERADIFRLELLRERGGVYVDVDLECRRAIDELIAGLDFFAAYLSEPDETGSRVGNGIIGATRDHPILIRAVEEVSPRPDGALDKGTTGTVFLTALLDDFPNAKIFPSAVFYPLTRAEKENAVAIHHWARSWKTVEELRADLVEKDARLAKATREVERLRVRLATIEGSRVWRLAQAYRRMVDRVRRRARFGRY